MPNKKDEISFFVEKVKKSAKKHGYSEENLKSTRGLQFVHQGSTIMTLKLSIVLTFISSTCWVGYFGTIFSPLVAIMGEKVGLDMSLLLSLVNNFFIEAVICTGFLAMIFRDLAGTAENRVTRKFFNQDGDQDFF